jgi:hypothetical protein
MNFFSEATFLINLVSTIIAFGFRLLDLDAFNSSIAYS